MSTAEAKKKVYISGPMTGIEGFNYPEFDMVAQKLEEMEMIPINPTRQPDGLTYQQYMEYAFLDVKNADALLLLDGWEDSKGARAEVEFAKSLGKEIQTSWVYL